MKKLADLLPDTQLQPHQQALHDAAEEAPLKKMLIHALGSGKTLTAIGAAEANKEPYTAIVPAALRNNFRGEQKNFTDQQLPSKVISYNELAKGTAPQYPNSLIFDEFHRLRNQNSAQSQQALAAAQKAKQLIMLSGTPIVNSPGDLATPVSMLTGKQMTPETFENRYVGPEPKYDNPLAWMLNRPTSHEPGIQHRDELKALLRGHVDYYDPGKPTVPTKYEDHHVEMGKEQAQIYKAMWDQLPYPMKMKLKYDFPMNDNDLEKATSFLTGPRQIGLSTLNYMKNPDPYKAYGQSPKLQKAMALLQDKFQDPRAKALVFSNFIDSGLSPYAAALQRANIPHAVFHGGLSDAQRKQLVEDYNNNKIRVALLGPSGTEGLSFKGTNLVQLLDPHYNSIRGQQSVGRGLRFGAHEGLPPELQNVTVQRLIARLPPGLAARMMSVFGGNPAEPATDDHLIAMAKRKEALNDKFMKLLQEVGTRNR